MVPPQRQGRSGERGGSCPPAMAFSFTPIPLASSARGESPDGGGKKGRGSGGVESTLRATCYM